ncbi:aldehyde dehydrogenase family protein [Govanella unica]|uniref:Aldehyde dehydrogenase family protein n=1 Tax=Govanella unica TaxID=2975056 RepID=A0A9X3TYR7_9PROT|nr:aldehyde dehydrogenase family protein [Govania unica]MDA5193867.1 aldehyde dehydrogenase family protein [Govania unica]
MTVPASLVEFLSQTRPMLIGGNWIRGASENEFDVVNPATEAVIARVSGAGEADIDAAVKAAQIAFESGVWAMINPYEKSKILWRVAELLEQNIEQLAYLNTLENGKPLGASRAGDVPAAAKTFRHYAGLCTKIEGKTPQISSAPDNFHAYTRHEPIGVVGQIVPWNGPIVALSWKIAPALAAGCTIVFKPAEETPLTSLYIGQLLLEAGVPAGVVNIVPGYGHIAGAAITAHPGIRKVSFTGSTEVGRHIIQSSSGNFKKLSLELGGKSPLVIFADADLERAIPAAANAIFFNAGQVCIAGSRLYVEAPVYEQVVQGIAKIATTMRVGPGLDSETEMGPVISRQQFERVLGFIEKGREEGARVLAGGGRVGDKGYFIQPTVLGDMRQDMTLVREEIFGPVLCAMKFHDMAEIVEKANDTDYGLAASIWTSNLSKAHNLAARIEAGLVWINCHAVSDPSVAFGGYKLSGWGRENGWEGMEQYTETKSVIANIT